MELRAFAEQVLFSDRLDVKLAPVSEVIDESPGPGIPTPDQPGRPPALRWNRSRKSDARFPGLQRVEEEAQRGRLLHFFANHELLAAELMALVLLKFPNAPKSFRLGVFNTLKEEQAHTRMYLKRMRECGVAFGDLPVSGYFWKSVSNMESPLDYVARLSLTFEQANLDYSRFYAEAFRKAGDESTGKILDRIYRDEIGHVRYGLHWFRQWKRPDASDWDAFSGQLPFPLSPSRAKGIGFNVEGRNAAGLDPEFIRRLRVFSQSKGRTPNVLVFNPFAEDRAGLGKQFTPRRRQAQLKRDLGALPQFLCPDGDIVLVEHKPTLAHRERLQDAGFPSPEFALLDQGRLSPESPIRNRKLNQFLPWAWDPEIQKLYQDLKPNLRAEEPSNPGWKEAWTRLYSKTWQASLEGRLTRELKSKLPEPELQVVAVNFEDVRAGAERIRSSHPGPVLIKAPFGNAGQNRIRLVEPTLPPPQVRWIEKNLNRYGSLVLEPWRARICDISAQFEMTAKGARLIGMTRMFNDAKGQYRGSLIHSTLERVLPDPIIAWHRSAGHSAKQLRALYAEMGKLLQRDFEEVQYVGPFGVDGFYFWNTQGKIALRPMVEINPRITLGRVALEAAKHLNPGVAGFFALLTKEQVRGATDAGFAEFAKEESTRHPLKKQGSPTPRLSEGFVSLTDPESARDVLAVLWCSKDLPAMISDLTRRRLMEEKEPNQPK